MLESLTVMACSKALYREETTRSCAATSKNEGWSSPAPSERSKFMPCLPFPSFAWLRFGLASCSNWIRSRFRQFVHCRWNWKCTLVRSPLNISIVLYVCSFILLLYYYYKIITTCQAVVVTAIKAGEEVKQVKIVSVRCHPRAHPTVTLHRFPRVHERHVPSVREAG